MDEERAPDFRELLRAALRPTWCQACGQRAAAAELEPTLYEGKVRWFHPRCAEPYLWWECAAPEDG